MVSFPQLSFTCKGSGIIPAFYCLSSHDDLIDEDHFEEISSVRSLLPLESPFCGPSAQISRTKKCILYVHLRDKQNFNFPSACLRIPYGLLAGLRKKKKSIFKLVLIIPMLISVRATLYNMIIKC